MPYLNIDFEVFCGVCGTGCCPNTDVRGTTVTITCPTCACASERADDFERELDEANSRIKDLEVQLCAYTDAAEFKAIQDTTKTYLEGEATNVI